MLNSAESGATPEAGSALKVNAFGAGANVIGRDVSPFPPPAFVATAWRVTGPASGMTVASQ